MPTPDIYSLLMGAGPDAAESAAALAEQIRRGRQVSMAGALGSPNAIGAMGKVAADTAKQDEGLLERAAESRMKSGEEAKARETALKMTLAQIAANKPQFHLTPNNPGQAGYVLMPDGTYAPIGTPDRPKPPPGVGGPGSPAEQREFNALNKEMTPEFAVRSAFGAAGQQDYNAIRGIALAVRNKQAPNTAQQAELAGLAGRMVTGGVPTLHTMEQFNPGSASKTAAVVQQWLSGKPVDPDMQEWADSMLKMMEGESDAGQRFIRNIRLRNAERVRRYAAMNPESARRFIANFGLDQEHPEGYIDPQSFELRNYKPGRNAAEIQSGTGAGAAPVKVNTKEERDALPPGTLYVGPDGHTARR